jgi:hypothetical protein
MAGILACLFGQTGMSGLRFCSFPGNITQNIDIFVKTVKLKLSYWDLKNLVRQSPSARQREKSMSLKSLTTFLLGIGLLALSPAPLAAYIIDNNGGGNGGNNNSDPKTYAILVGSRAPSNGIADAIRGDLDVDHVAAQLSWATDVKKLTYQWDGADTFASDIQSATSSIASVMKPGDSFIFYYSGHGTGGSAEGLHDYLNPVQGSGYQDNSLAGLFANSQFAGAKKFFLIDSCHSEGIWKNDTASDFDLEALGNISFLSSSSEDGVAFSDTAKTGTSYFTNAILPSLTPDATFGSLLASAMTAGGAEVTGFFKDDGHGSGLVQPLGFASADFDLSATLGSPAVPEPAAWILMLLGGLTLMAWRRRAG